MANAARRCCTSAGLFTPAVNLVHGSPSPTFGFVFGDATILVAFLDVLGLSFFLVGVLRFVSAGHKYLLCAECFFAETVPVKR